MLEAEDHFEGERKELTGRLEALDSIVRMLELKHKNSLDHASRLEERENELKKVSRVCISLFLKTGLHSVIVLMIWWTEKEFNDLNYVLF